MSKKNRILEGLESALQHAKGEQTAVRVSVVHVPKTVDVRNIRQKLKMSQKAFSIRFGFNISTLRQWEQGRRQPDGSAQILLKIIDKESDAVDRALAL